MYASITAHYGTISQARIAAANVAKWALLSITDVRVAPFETGREHGPAVA